METVYFAVNTRPLELHSEAMILSAQTNPPREEGDSSNEKSELLRSGESLFPCLASNTVTLSLACSIKHAFYRKDLQIGLLPELGLVPARQSRLTVLRSQARACGVFPFPCDGSGGQPNLLSCLVLSREEIATQDTRPSLYE